VLDFISPRHNRLAYRVSGLTDQWIDLGAQRRITLTNLNAGDHVLEVRAANADSVWSESPLRITLHREPAPWRSWWAYSIYALALVAVILYRLYRQRVKFNDLKRARERLEAEVEARTHELRESNSQLAEAARAKSQFLDRMSHELRTPMNGVIGMIELLARTELTSKQSQLTQTIRASANVLLQIVNDLLDLSKIQAGKVMLEDLPIDLVQVLEECTGLFSAAAQAKNVELIVCPPAQDRPGLRGDSLRIRQILMNLVGNAVKFTARGEIVVQADIETPTPGRAMLQLAVSDTGIGMDEKTIGLIFQPFTQADESTTRRFGGSGLGLAICRELTELMGGTISVTSRPHVGSTFSVRLPLILSDELPTPARDYPLTQARARILTRRPALAESLTRHLSALGMTVLAGGDDHGHVREDVLLIDAGDSNVLQSQLATADSRKIALVVVAGETELESSRGEWLIESRPVVSKPVQRSALRAALVSALGAPAGTVDTPARLPGTAPGAHILLVEDEEVNAAVAQGYLSELGCTCVWVKDGAEAVAQFGAERFDLILMDLSMPKMDGFATTALIRQRVSEPRVPIIALSAHDAATYRDTCLAAGMDDILSKPYTLEQCSQLLRLWVGSGDERVLQPTAARVSNEAPSVSVPPADTALSHVDLKTIAGLRKLHAGTSRDLYSQLVELFRKSSSEALTQLRAALDVADYQAARAVCHKLTSGAANVGALEFAKQVRELGQHCAAGNHAAARDLHACLERAYPELMERLQSARLRATA